MLLNKAFHFSRSLPLTFGKQYREAILIWMGWFRLGGFNKVNIFSVTLSSGSNLLQHNSDQSLPPPPLPRPLPDLGPLPGGREGVSQGRQAIHFLLCFHFSCDQGGLLWMIPSIHHLLDKNTFCSVQGLISSQGSICLCSGSRALLLHLVPWYPRASLVRNAEKSLETDEEPWRAKGSIGRRWWVCTLSKITATAQNTAVAVNPWAPVGGNTVGMVTVPELMSHVFQAW